MPPHQRHPQTPSSAQTGTPNFDTFFSHLFMILTCEQMTIKHSIYAWKVPFLCTERACVVFSVSKFTLEEKRHRVKCCKFYEPEGLPLFLFINTFNQYTKMASAQEQRVWF